jgi:hypothetical protein
MYSKRNDSGTTLDNTCNEAYFTIEENLLTHAVAADYIYRVHTNETGDSIYVKEGSSEAVTVASAANDQYRGLTLETTLQAFKGNFGYRLKSDGTFETYNLQTWVNGVKSAVANYTDILDLSEASVITSFTDANLANFSLTDEGMIVDGDLIVFAGTRSSTADFAVINISDPSNPALVQSVTLTWGDGISPIHAALSGSKLYLYGFKDGSSGTPSYFKEFQIWNVNTAAAPVKSADVDFGTEDFFTTYNYTHHIIGSNIYLFDYFEKSFKVWDLTDPANVSFTSAGLHSGFSVFDLFPNNYDYKRDFTVEGDKIYLPSDRNVEIVQYQNGVITFLEYLYAGVPLKGVYKFENDPYVYALGYNSINILGAQN